MTPTRVFPLLAALLLAGCDSESAPATPPQFEQAKADCEPHGGIASVKMVYVLFRPNRVDAVCRNEVRISRDDR